MVQSYLFLILKTRGVFKSWEEKKMMECNLMKEKWSFKYLNYLTVFTHGSPQYKLIPKSRLYQLQMSWQQTAVDECLTYEKQEFLPHTKSCFVASLNLFNNLTQHYEHYEWERYICQHSPRSWPLDLISNVYFFLCWLWSS